MPDTIRFAGYPTALVYEGEPRKSKVKKQLLWGDWIRVKPSNGGAFVPVHVRGEDGFMATADMQKERLLELIFVDVGQGDGCLIITPEDKQVVLDAGEGRNMASFLKWRFAGFKQRFNFKAAIISHSDKDHYAGFGDLFQLPNVYFDTVYTNGLMERVAAKDSEALGVPQSH
jgi:beta-lactamase superfamily II metal-dependent hydrolase